MGIGLGLGVLFAPEAGEVSRRKLKQYAEDALNAEHLFAFLSS